MRQIDLCSIRLSAKKKKKKKKKQKELKKQLLKNVNMNALRT